MSVPEVARPSECSVGEIGRRIDERELCGVRTEEGWRLPARQVAGGLPLAMLAEVLAAVPAGPNPVVFARWFTSQDAVAEVADGPGG